MDKETNKQKNPRLNAPSSRLFKVYVFMNRVDQSYSKLRFIYAYMDFLAKILLNVNKHNKLFQHFHTP